MDLALAFLKHSLGKIYQSGYLFQAGYRVSSGISSSFRCASLLCHFVAVVSQYRLSFIYALARRSSLSDLSISIHIFLSKMLETPRSANFEHERRLRLRSGTYSTSDISNFNIAPFFYGSFRIISPAASAVTFELSPRLISRGLIW